VLARGFHRPLGGLQRHRRHGVLVHVWGKCECSAAECPVGRVAAGGRSESATGGRPHDPTNVGALPTVGGGHRGGRGPQEGIEPRNENRHVHDAHVAAAGGGRRAVLVVHVEDVGDAEFIAHDAAPTDGVVGVAGGVDAVVDAQRVARHATPQLRGPSPVGVPVRTVCGIVVWHSVSSCFNVFCFIVLLCVIVFYRDLLCVIVLHRVASCFIVCHRVSSCFIVFHRVSSCFIVLHRVLLCVIVLHRAALHALLSSFNFQVHLD
jgi:hypothetical protein